MPGGRGRPGIVGMGLAAGRYLLFEERLLLLELLEERPLLRALARSLCALLFWLLALPPLLAACARLDFPEEDDDLEEEEGEELRDAIVCSLLVDERPHDCRGQPSI